MFTPYGDRNLVSASINAGFASHAPLPGRDNDTFGVEMGTAWASSAASGFDRRMQVFEPSVHTPIRSSETFVEATYQFQVLPSWQIQPDVQYFINPGMEIANPDAPTQRIRNEFVVGLRTNVNFDGRADPDGLSSRRACAAGSWTRSCTGRSVSCPDRRSDARAGRRGSPRESPRGSA